MDSYLARIKRNDFLCMLKACRSQGCTIPVPVLRTIFIAVCLDIGGEEDFDELRDACMDPKPIADITERLLARKVDLDTINNFLKKMQSLSTVNLLASYQDLFPPTFNKFLVQFKTRKCKLQDVKFYSVFMSVLYEIGASEWTGLVCVVTDWQMVDTLCTKLLDHGIDADTIADFLEKMRDECPTDKRLVVSYDEDMRQVALKSNKSYIQK